jgi:hypothetical protein
MVPDHWWIGLYLSDRMSGEHVTDVHDMQAGGGAARWRYFVFFIAASMTRSIR